MLLLCRRKAANYRQNLEFQATCFSVNKFVVDNSLQYFEVFQNLHLNMN